MGAEQSAELLENGLVGSSAKHVYKPLYLTVIGHQVGHDRLRAKLLLDRREYNFFLDREVIGKLEVVPVYGAGGAPDNGLGQYLAFQGTIGQNTKSQAIVMLLRERHKRPVAEHVFTGTTSVGEIGAGQSRHVHFVAWAAILRGS